MLTVVALPPSPNFQVYVTELWAKFAVVLLNVTGKGAQPGFGVAVNAAFVSGGFYSLDGLNLTPRGNALLANEFIKAINSTYGSSIPEVDAMKYPAVIFP